MADIVKTKFHELLHFVFPKNCFEELVLNLNIFHRKFISFFSRLYLNI